MLGGTGMRSLKFSHVSGALGVGIMVLWHSLPIFAQAGGNVEQTVTGFFDGVQSLLQGVAVAAAATSFLTLGLIYMLSTWPPVAQYKAQHPDLMQNIIVGLVIILFVSGGTLAGLIAF
jgi:hypothetical protein